MGAFLKSTAVIVKLSCAHPQTFIQTFLYIYMLFVVLFHFTLLYLSTVISYNPLIQ